MTQEELEVLFQSIRDESKKDVKRTKNTVHDKLRYGQQVFNRLHDIYPEVMDEHIRSKKGLDPFFIDENVEPMFDKLREILIE